MIDYTLNAKQAKRLFEENSVYIEGADIITVDRAQKLFGEPAIEFANRSEANKREKYGIKGYCYCGFVDMVTMHNIRMISSGKAGEGYL